MAIETGPDKRVTINDIARDQIMTPDHFVAALEELDFADTLIPNSDRCAVCDHPDAPQRRCHALLTLLQAATRSEIDSLWIGRDLGYRGGDGQGLPSPMTCISLTTQSGGVL